MKKIKNLLLAIGLITAANSTSLIHASTGTTPPTQTEQNRSPNNVTQTPELKTITPF